jgi:hypothetical protein
MNINNIVKLIPNKETRKQKAMRNLNKVVSQIVVESNTTILSNKYYMNTLRKQYINQERIALSRNGDIGLIFQYRKTVEKYIRI